MAIAILSDIQGNAVALESVLREMPPVDHVICLGDIASGPEPQRVITLLQAANCKVVRGNMDDFILNPVPYTGQDENEQKYSRMDQWCSKQLSDQDRAYISSFPLTISCEDLLCFHGSPHSNEDVIDGKTDEAVLHQLLDDIPYPIMATGHMHEPMLRRFNDITIINPGSVGLPFGGKRMMPLVAEYAVIASHDITFRRVHYSGELFKQRVLASGMPFAEWYLEKWRG